MNRSLVAPFNPRPGLSEIAGNDSDDCRCLSKSQQPEFGRACQFHICQDSFRGPLRVLLEDNWRSADQTVVCPFGVIIENADVQWTQQSRSAVSLKQVQLL